MKICPNCGAKYDSDNDIFCGECGAKLNDKTTTNSTKISDSDDVATQTAATQSISSTEEIQNYRRKKTRTSRRKGSRANNKKPEELAEEIDFYKFFASNKDAKKCKDFEPFDRSTDRSTIYQSLTSLQGYVCGNDNTAKQNQQEKLEELKNILNNACKVFKNDDNRKKYDEALDAAYAANKITDQTVEDLPTQPAQNVWQMLAELFDNEQYVAVINECNKMIAAGTTDISAYHFKSMASYELGDKKCAYETINETQQKFPNDAWNLKLGARYSTIDGNYNNAQDFINTLTTKQPEHPLATIEQCYLYERMDKQELAFKLIDEYLEKNPHNEDFRRDCAYDMMALSNTYFTRDPESGTYIIASREDYEKCLAVCEKAATIYNNDYIAAKLEDTKFFGQTKYNWDNKWRILALFIGGIFYFLIGLLTIAQGGFVGLLLGAGLIFSGYRLHKLSYRPYWQINKYFLTGKREPDEAKYIMIGKIFVGYLKWSFKIGWWITKTFWKFMARA